MTEAIYSWMQNLICYFILLFAVMNLLPDSSYKKYIRYYMGLLLILIVFSPVLHVTGIQNEIDEYITEFRDMDYDEEEWRQKAQRWEENWEQKITVVEGQEVIP